MEKKSTLLKVSGILMIIFAAILIVIYIIGLLGAGFLASVAAEIGDAGAIMYTGVAMIAIIVLLIGAVIQLIAGILGVKNHNKPEKATVCIVFGVIIVVAALAGLIMDISGGPFGVTQVLMIIGQLVLPVLYLLGAFQLKKLA